MISIPYMSEHFPNGTTPNHSSYLSVDWHDILWSALTVGRPNRQDVFQHGMASAHEAIFRTSLVRMALEQKGPWGYRLNRTQAARTLDPTEKGAVNYFLGMTFCKLFAAKLLQTPWVMHLDVYRPQLDPVLTGRSRPDLIGQHESTGAWHAFECKGRLSQPDSNVKAKAKSQAQRVVSVNQTACSLHVGAVTYFKSDILQFYWRDPEPEKRLPVFPISHTEDLWRYYYGPTVELLRDAVGGDPVTPLSGPGRLIPIEAMDLSIGVHPKVARLIFREQWAEARSLAGEIRTELAESGFQPDGIRLEAGASWSKRFVDRPPSSSSL